jgi:DNA polymerase III epsilon subunit-like protein
MKLIFLDTETTGNTKDDFLCQIAYHERGTSEFFNELYKPLKPIPPEASAVTHITNKHVADKPEFKTSGDYENVKQLLESDDVVLVAHNAVFDIQMLQNEGINPKNFICTLRVARDMDESGVIPKYNLQFLRYYLELEVEAQAHDALGDIKVLEALFDRLLKKMIERVGGENSEENAIQKMLEVSSHPSILRNFSFGKYVGRTIEEVAKMDRGYLEWLYEQKKSSDQNEEDWLYTLHHFLGK